MTGWVLHSFLVENDYIIKDISHFFFFYRFSSKLFSTTLCFHILAIVLWRILNSSLICIRLFCDPIKGHCESRCSLSRLFEATIFGNCELPLRVGNNGRIWCIWALNSEYQYDCGEMPSGRKLLFNSSSPKGRKSTAGVWGKFQ